MHQCYSVQNRSLGQLHSDKYVVLTFGSMSITFLQMFYKVPNIRCLLKMICTNEELELGMKNVSHGHFSSPSGLGISVPHRTIQMSNWLISKFSTKFNDTQLLRKYSTLHYAQLKLNFTSNSNKNRYLTEDVKSPIYLREGIN